MKADGGVCGIIAKSPSNTLGPCSNDFPCIQVDYELGTQMLYYIRSQSSPTVKLSPSKTLLGNPMSSKLVKNPTGHLQCSSHISCTRCEYASCKRTVSFVR